MASNNRHYHIGEKDWWMTAIVVLIGILAVLQPVALLEWLLAVATDRAVLRQNKVHGKGIRKLPKDRLDLFDNRHSTMQSFTYTL
jgi:hypothetical protein